MDASKAQALKEHRQVLRFLHASNRSGTTTKRQKQAPLSVLTSMMWWRIIDDFDAHLEHVQAPLIEVRVR
jgi:hypothetical protein